MSVVDLDIKDGDATILNDSTSGDIDFEALLNTPRGNPNINRGFQLPSIALGDTSTKILLATLILVVAIGLYAVITGKK